MSSPKLFVVAFLVLLGSAASVDAVCDSQAGITTSKTGPSTSVPPYVDGDASKIDLVASILTVEESVGDYVLNGLIEGVATIVNPLSKENFNLYAVHSFEEGQGDTREYGFKGSYISRWEIDRETLTVRSGRDLVSNFDDMHFLTSSASALSKLYLADIPVESALRNANSKRGTAESLLFVGENKDNGRAFAFQLTGEYEGHGFELRDLGKLPYGAIVPSPAMQDTTLLAITSPSGYLFFYKGTKATGTSSAGAWRAVRAAGLEGGAMYCVTVNQYPTETAGIFGLPKDFSLKQLKLGSTPLQTSAASSGCTRFMTPQGGKWNPSNSTQFWFTTQGTLSADITNSRLWSLNFKSTNPSAGSAAGKLEQRIDDEKFEFGSPLKDVAFDTLGARVYLTEGQSLGKEEEGLLLRVDPSPTVPSSSAMTCIASTRTMDAARLNSIVDVVDSVGPGFFLASYQDGNVFDDESPVGSGGQLVLVYDRSVSTPAASLVITSLVTDPPRQIYNVTDDIEFMATSYNPNAVLGVNGGQSVTTYRWQFGDGELEFENTGMVTHNYKEEGVYKVTVTASKEGVSDGVATIDVRVGVFSMYPPPTTYSTAPPQGGQTPSVPGPVPKFGSHAFFTGVFMLGFSLMMVGILALAFIVFRYAEIGG